MSAKRSGEERKIEKIALKKKIVTIVFDDGEKIELNENSYTEFRLYVGKKVNSAEFSHLEEYAKQDLFYNAALRRLSKENYSVHEIREKLFDKGADTETVKKIIFRLKKQGLLDDALYAKTFAEDVADLRCLGKNRILYVLHSKGIPQDIINSLSFPEEKEMEKAMRLAVVLDKKYSRAPMANKAFKMLKALTSKGFEEPIAEAAALKAITPNDKDDEMVRLSRLYESAYLRYSRKYEGYERQRRIFAYLINKGYSYDQVKEVMDSKGGMDDDQ